MARRQGAGGIRTGQRTSRKGTRTEGKTADDGPSVYQEILAEASMSPTPESYGPSRAAKRRKILQAAMRSTAAGSERERFEGELSTPTHERDVAHHATPFQQTLFDVSGDSAASDEDFEDVRLDSEIESPVLQESNQIQRPLEIDLSRPVATGGRPSIQKRKQATSSEKKTRLDVHKWHLLCLLLHGHYRSKWCDADMVQKLLKPLIPRKLISLLHTDENKPQYQRNHSFNEAIKDICEIWIREWKITAQGMKRPFWKEDVDVETELNNAEDPIDLEDFKESAEMRSGSRDLGAQLFCALLRSVAVDTRLVFSLQTLPFSGVAKGFTPERPRQGYIYASSMSQSLGYDHVVAEEQALLSNPRTRLQASKPVLYTRETPSRQRIKESPYPVFWVEVFNEAIQAWIPLDPLVRRTINKPRTGFEPPASDQLNSMSYVIAFEDDGSAKDVTRRYTQHFNAKTRKTRVEGTKGGERWWTKTMSFFEKSFPEDRTDIEDAELTKREAQEPMPRNVQDFKGHPHYALARHLHRNQAIHPMRQVGRVSVGSSKDPKVEPVYRRRDVHLVRSAEQWYRHGRDVKVGEPPLKRVVTRRREAQLDEAETEGTSLYAEFQTQLYMPPSVVRGRIPKNAYGNLDAYLPSMIPAGAVHIEHPAAAQAAKILGIDYADAVTGFEFRGRQGTAVIKGIVAAEECREALVEVLQEIQDERVRAEEDKRSMMALQTWKRFMTALKIKDQVNKEYAEGGAVEADEAPVDASHAEDKGEEAAGGGFFHDDSDQAVTWAPRPETRPSDGDALLDVGPSHEYGTIIIKESPHKLPAKLTESSEDKRGGFLVDQADSIAEQGGFLPAGKALGDSREAFVAAEGDSKPGVDTQTPSQRHSTDGNQKLYASAAVNRTSKDPEDSEEAKLPEMEEQTTIRPQPQSPTAAAQVNNSTLSDNSAPTPDDEENETAMLESNTDRQERSPFLKANDSRAGSASGGSGDDDDDDGSLLSHDPEDEDAEPDWLVG